MSKMEVDFVLVAEGGIGCPNLDISVFGGRDEVEELAGKMAARLHLAGYVRFTLYDVRAEHVAVQSYTVEQSAPVVTRKK